MKKFKHELNNFEDFGKMLGSEMNDNNQKEAFTEKDAEDIVKTALGDDVFEDKKESKQEIKEPKSLRAAAAKKEESHKDRQHHIYKEIDRLGGKLVDAKRKFREAKTAEEKDRCEKEVVSSSEEFEKAKAARDRMKEEKNKESVRKIIKSKQPVKSIELQADIAASQSKTYGNVYAKESILEDALEQANRLKNIKKTENLHRFEGEKELEKEASEIKFTNEQQAKIESKFVKFGINKEDIEKIEGLKKLSYGQRLLVAENLKQITLGRIQEEAFSKYQTGQKESLLLGKIWKGITKKYQISKQEKITAEEITKGGIKTHGEVLKQLVNGAKNLNLEVIEKPTGKLEIQYLSGLRDFSPDRNKVEDFNEIASQFSGIPKEWSLETATKEQQIKFSEISDKYEKVKADILAELKLSGRSDKESCLILSDIDNKVRLNQFLNTHSEAEKELQNIQSDWAWTKAFKNIITERGIYFGAGFAVRSATMSMLGAIGLPIAASVMGGYIGRKRAKETLKEHEIMARRGVKDTAETAKNFVNADDLTKKIDLLINKIGNEQDEEKRKELLASLKARLDYTNDKIDSGLVNFGSADKRILNQYNLIDKLNLGNSYDKIDDTDLSERLDEFLNFKEREIKESQQKYIRNEMIKGAVLGAAFATAGYAVRHYFGEDISKAVISIKEHLFGKSTFVEVPFKFGTKISLEEFKQRYPGIKYEEAMKESGGKLKETIAQEIIPPKPAAEIENIIMPIGARGPEGALIDYFRENPEAAKNFGWDGETDLDKWAGMKAHKLWVDDAQEAIKKPETLDQLKKLGYSADADGYAKMMHRIGKGAVELDLQTGKINLVDTEYLKARISEAEIPTKETTIHDLPPEEEIPPQTTKIHTPSPSPETAPEISSDNIKNWLGDRMKISPEKFSWLNETNLKNITVKEVSGYNFTRPFGIEAHTGTEMEIGSQKWLEFEEKSKLHDLVKNIMKEMEIDAKKAKIPAEQIASVKKTFEDMNLRDFFKTRIEYLHKLSEIVAQVKK